MYVRVRTCATVACVTASSIYHPPFPIRPCLQRHVKLFNIVSVSQIFYAYLLGSQGNTITPLSREAGRAAGERNGCIRAGNDQGCSRIMTWRAGRVTILSNTRGESQVGQGSVRDPTRQNGLGAFSCLTGRVDPAPMRSGSGDPILEKPRE